MSKAAKELDDQRKEILRLKANVSSTCAHSNYRLRGNDPPFWAYCPDCDTLLPIDIWGNDLITRIRKGTS